MESASSMIFHLYSKRMVGEDLTESEEQIIRDRIIRLKVEENWKDYQKDLVLLSWFDSNKDAAWKRLYSKYKNQNTPQQASVRKIYAQTFGWVVAAIVILLLGIRTYQYFWSEQTERAAKNPITNKDKSNFTDDNSVVIVLGNNTKVPLIEGHKGIIAKQGSTQLEITTNGELVYKRDPALTEKSEGFNTIQVPRGKQFDITLPDGTKVSLNAASTIKFPVSFDRLERKVELIGEAKFIVQKDKVRPFIVISDIMKVEATGTIFNVKAHKDERNKTVTLLEGVVNVNIPGARQQLKPLEQMVVRDNSMQVIYPVDSIEVLAWKEKHFHYNNRELKTIMAEIARWYKVEVVYEGQLQNAKFMMQHVPREWPLERVIDVLERTGDLRFKLESNRITVLK